MVLISMFLTRLVFFMLNCQPGFIALLLEIDLTDGRVFSRKCGTSELQTSGDRRMCF